MTTPDELRKARLERAQRWITNTSPSEPAELPPAAEKAADLDALKKTVEDAASVSGGLWLSYLFALFYIAVATGAVTHADLFLQRAVKLPFLGVELPLKAFFALAPILFLITHAYTLVHFVLLAAKAKRFHAELKAQIQDENAPDAAVLREGLRGQLPSNIFVQFLAGPRELREGLFGRFLALIALITLVIAPLALLLLLQIQFLPYHDSAITWTHRVALVLDLALVWWLWRKILAGQSEIIDPRWRTVAINALSLTATAVVLVFSWMLATFPGEWENRPLVWIAAKASPSLNKGIFAATNWLFNGAVDWTSRRRISWFSNTLVLPGFSIYEALKIDDPKKVEWRDLFDARGRDLNGAAFDGAILPQTDFYGAQLKGASIQFAKLKSAKFDDANLRGALFSYAQLQGASLGAAQLQGASLDNAQLQSASLDYAKLEGAVLHHAELQGASLYATSLQAASLDYAQLQGALLHTAQLQGASLRGAKLHGARLWNAQLWGASVQGAQLNGGSLQYSRLVGARLDDADMTATDLSNAFVWRAVFPRDTPKNLLTSTLNWRPETRDGSEAPLWTSASYDALRRQIAEIVPEGYRRNEALERIRSLDCGTGGLSSCDATAPEPASVAAARRMIERASVGDATYKKALAGVLGDLVCGGDAPADAVHILRGLLKNGRIADAGVEALALVERILSKDCPVSAVLADDDKAQLRAVAKKPALPSPKKPAPAPPPARKK